VGAIEAMIAAMQQQNANMVNQQNLALQQMESARLAAEAAQQRHMEALHQIGENRLAAGSSQASLPRVQEWRLEDFLQHHPSRFDGKVSPDGASYNTSGCGTWNESMMLRDVLQRTGWHTLSTFLLERSCTGGPA